MVKKGEKKFIGKNFVLFLVVLGIVVILGGVFTLAVDPTKAYHTADDISPGNLIGTADFRSPIQIFKSLYVGETLGLASLESLPRFWINSNNLLEIETPYSISLKCLGVPNCLSGGLSLDNGMGVLVADVVDLSQSTSTAGYDAKTEVLGVDGNIIINQRSVDLSAIKNPDFSCLDGQVLKFDGTNFVCSNLVSGGSSVVVVSGIVDLVDSGKGCYQYGGQQVQDSRFIGKTKANVEITGWNLRYNDGTHKIRQVAVRPIEINFNSQTGVVSWVVSACLSDKNADDWFRLVKYGYVVIVQ